MKITKVTFTGADDTTNVKDLEQLSKENPYIEWGILYSNKQAGNGGKYPSEKKILELLSGNYETSIHLCGKVSRDFIIKGHTSSDTHELIKYATRIQLNFNATKTPPVFDNFFEAKNGYRKPIIVQVNPANQHFINSIVPYTGNDIHYLFDASGGNGIEIQSIPEPIPGKICIYAGGLKPKNLKKKIIKIAEVVGGDFRIDMETGVRTNEQFDLNKVKECINIINEFNK